MNRAQDLSTQSRRFARAWLKERDQRPLSSRIVRSRKMAPPSWA